MCLHISEDKKAQPAKGFPKGWSFFFRSSGTTLDELCIRSPAGLTMRSVAAACARHTAQLSGIANLEHDFHLHIGETLSDSAYSPSHHGKRKSEGDGSAERKPKKAKSDRVLEYKRDMGSRVWARFENGQYYWGEIVKKRLKKSKNKKGKRYHYAVRYDDGDYLSDISDDTEYRRTDLKMYTEEQIFELKGRRAPPRPSDPSRPPAQIITTYTAAELYRFRCASCSFCEKKPCTRCTSCRNNASNTMPQIECCLQKVK